MKIPIFFITICILLSLALTFIADLVGAAMTGEANGSFLCEFICFLAYWPSHLLKVKADDLYFFSVRTQVINCTGWGLLGFIIGILFIKFKT